MPNSSLAFKIVESIRPFIPVHENKNTFANAELAVSSTARTMEEKATQAKPSNKVQTLKLIELIWKTMKNQISSFLESEGTPLINIQNAIDSARRVVDSVISKVSKIPMV